MTKFDIDTDSVRKLAELLKETGLSEIEYAEGDRRIKVAGGLPSSITYAAAPIAPAASEPAKESAPETPAVKAGDPVTAPMVGTVYLSSSPTAAPFVKVGDKVKEGDTLLIIEAMKVMNPIKAPRGGEIVQILVETGKPVEFGEQLLLIG